MASLQRTISRGSMFAGMNAKQKKIRRKERRNARKNRRVKRVNNV